MILLQAWRSWRSAKGVALLVAAALAAGIGSATAIYTVVNAVMLKPLPYRDGERYVVVLGAATNDPEHYSSLLFKDAQTYQERNRSFDAFGWYRESGKNLMYAGKPLHVQGVIVTEPLVHQLGVDPAMGRWFQDENGVVISSSLWRQLGADEGIVGKALTLDQRRYTVSGVMPDSFRLPIAGIASVGTRPDVWMGLDPQGRGEPGGGFFVYARRKPGVTFAAAEADVKRIAAEVAREEPANHSLYTARLFDLRESAIKDIRPTLLLLFGAAGLLFLITCGNAAGLLLARSVSRAKETAIRVAMGAAKGQLAALYFFESLLISLAGAAGGIAISVVLTRAIVSMAADYLPRAEEIAVDGKVLLFAVAAAVLASGISSLAPLWQAVRTAPADALGDGVRASAGARSRRVLRGLVVGEIALAFALLATSVVLLLHLQELSRVSAGFVADRVLTFTLSLPGPVANDEKKRIPMQLRLIDAIKNIPGVEEVAFANQAPLNGCCMGADIYPEGRTLDLGASQRTSLMATSSAYLQTMRIPLKRGRFFTNDDWTRPGLAILPVAISEAAVKRYWGSDDPLGAFGRFASPKGDRFQVVGIVGNVKNDGLGNPPVPEIYMPGFVTRVETMSFFVRSPRPAGSLVTEIRRVVQGIDAEQPIHDVAMMTDIVRQSMALERTGSFLTSFFAGVALLMAIFGVYGIVAYSVRQRVVEIGMRMALGLTSGRVLQLIVGDGLRMASLGVVGGGVLAYAAVNYLGGFFNVGDPGATPFLYSTAIIAVVAFVASSLPAWRASLLSPLVAIRNEPESMWQAARSKARRAVEDLTSSKEEPEAVPIDALITEFSGSVRQAASFQDAMRVALEALRERMGARSIVMRPAVGAYLLGHLKRYPHPLALEAEDFEIWTRWAREFRPEHLAEIEELASTGARVAVPLRTKNEIVGVLLLGAPEGRAHYTATQKQVLGSSADVFALMMENARLTERALEQEKLRLDLEVAAEVQKRLLPPEPPKSNAATFAAFTLPARTVGGDYYDLLDLGEERIGIAVADVSGKGIAAALLMSVVQASLRVMSGDREMTLAELASKMSRFLYQSTSSSKYATFFYAQIEDHGRRLRYVNAGHNPPYLVRGSGAGAEILELTASGFPLGLFPVGQYEGAETELRSGDLLVAFTDGVSEALNIEGEEFGEERLKDLLRRGAGLPAERISTMLADAMREWIGAAEQHDDLTFVIVAVK